MGSNLKDLYGDYTEDAWAKDQRESDEAQEGDFLKMKEGKTQIRVLPPKKGVAEPFRVMYQHSIEIPGRRETAFFICPNLQSKVDKLPHQQCPACEYIDRMLEEGDPDAAKNTKAFKPRRNIACNCIVRGQEHRGARIYRFGVTVHDQMLALRDPSVGGNFSHPINGFDFVIVRKGTGVMDTEYKVFAANNGAPMPIMDTEEEIVEILETRQNLDAVALIPSYEECCNRMGMRSAGRAAPRVGGGQAAGGHLGQRRRTAGDDANEVDKS